MKSYKSLRVFWSKREKDLMFCYPDQAGKHLGYDLSVLIDEAIKKYAPQYDITSVKIEIKLKEEPKDGEKV